MRLARLLWLSAFAAIATAAPTSTWGYEGLRLSAATVDATPLVVESSLRGHAAITGEGTDVSHKVFPQVLLRYRQASLPESRGGAVRLVEQATAGPNGAALLRPNRAALLAFPAAGGVQLTSARGPLKRGELDALELPADPIDLAEALPQRAVSDGSSWRLPEAAVAKLLRLDTVEETQLTGVVTDITPTHVRFRLAGRVAGNVDGAETEIDAHAVGLYDRVQRHVSAFNLAWSEQRQLGPATPAMKATAKLNVTVRAATTDERIPAPLLSEAAQCQSEPRLLVQTGDRRWSLLADRDWFVVARDRNATTLRRVAAGRVTAITTLSTREREAPSTEAFASEVRTALGGQLQEVASVTAGKTASGLPSLEVVSLGGVEGQPLMWRHHHVRGPIGSIAAATTLPVEELPAEDGEVQALIDSLRPTAAEVSSRQAETR